VADAQVHGLPRWPQPLTIEQLRTQTQAGATDEYGVRQLELYYNDEAKAYCLLEGPDEEAVRRHHAALDVPCGEVNRGRDTSLTSLARSRAYWSV
jgi:hypothetical protein